MGLLLITIDCLRLDDLAHISLPDSQVFPCVSASPITPVACASILTGLYPPRHGLRNLRGASLSAGVTTLAQVLADAGWETHAVVGGRPLHAGTGLNRGFRVYDDNFPGSRRSCREVLARMVPPRERSFTWLHLFDLHAPLGTASDSLKDVLDARHAALRDVAASVSEMAGSCPECRIVVTGDHGEGFCGRGEPDGWLWHGERMEDIDLTVPLYLCRFGPCWRPWAARSIDILPTVCSELGLRAPDGIDGLALQEQSEEQWAYSESHLTPHRHYAHVRSVRKGLSCLTVGQNSFACRPAEHAAAMRRVLAGVSGEPPEGEQASLDDETRQQLKDLGYL
jgi:hypothetical protein